MPERPRGVKRIAIGDGPLELQRDFRRTSGQDDERDKDEKRNVFLGARGYFAQATIAETNPGMVYCFA